MLDFYCPKLRLGIELDGAGHDTPVQQQHDAMRTDWLKTMYVRIVRFRNEEVIGDISGVLIKIEEIATAPYPSSIEEGNLNQD